VSGGLRVVPVDLDVALQFIAAWHRHNDAPQGHRWSIGVAGDDDVLRGVATIGRPVARGNQDGVTVEVTRCCTDGTRNACSLLYGASARGAAARGFRRIITYTRIDEPGSSLRAAGWRPDEDVRQPRKGWDTPSRPREVTGSEGVARLLWFRILNPDARPYLSIHWPSGSAPVAVQMNLLAQEAS
jgi:hypothetical protein